MTLSTLYTKCRNIHPDSIFYVYIDENDYWELHHPLYEDYFESLPIKTITKIEAFFVDDVANVHILIDRSEAQ